MIAVPDARPRPRPRYASASASTVRPAYHAATSVPCPERGPSPARLAGISSPATTLIALLFRAVLSTAAPRPRRARYTALTAFGKLVTTASTSPPVTMSATAYRRPAAVAADLHDRARPDHRDQRRGRGDRVTPGARAGPDRLGEFGLLLVDRRHQPPVHPAGSRRRSIRARRIPRTATYRHQHHGRQRQPGRRGDHRGHRQQAHRGHPHRGHPGQDHHPAVEADPPGHHRRQPEQRRQVEHVRPDHHPRRRRWPGPRVSAVTAEVISGASAASAATSPSHASENPARSPSRSSRETSSQLARQARHHRGAEQQDSRHSDILRHAFLSPEGADGISSAPDLAAQQVASPRLALVHRIARGECRADLVGQRNR